MLTLSAGDVLFALVAALCAVIVYSAWYPGVFNSDEADMLTQGITHRFHDGHSPLLVRMWQLAGFVKSGPALPYLLATTTMTLFGALLIRRFLAAPATAALAFVLFVALPPVFVTLGLVTKDLFLATAMVAVIFCSARWLEKPGNARLAALYFCMQIAVLFRIDAVLALLPVVFWIAWFMLRQRGVARPVATAFAVMVAAGVLCAFLLTSRLLNTFVFDAKPFHMQEATMLFDLSALSLEANRTLVPASRLPNAGLTLEQLRARFRPADVQPLIWGTDPHRLIFTPLGDYPELRATWIRELLAHPAAYLNHRLEFTARFLGIRNDTPWILGQFETSGALADSAPEEGWRRIKSPLIDFYAELAGSSEFHYLYLPWVWLLLGLAVWCLAEWRARKATEPSHTSNATRLRAMLATSAIAHSFLMGAVATAALPRYYAWPRVACGLLIAVSLAQWLEAATRAKPPAP